jgi:hypothetical protein
MSDSQLLDYFKNYNSNTCGHFNNHQLDRLLVPQPPAKPRWYKWAFAMLFSGFLFSSKAKAQGEVKLTETIVKQEPFLKTRGKVATVVSQKSIELRGKIIDETGAGIPYASVQVVGGGWGVSTDSSGNFVLLSKPNNSKMLLSFSSVGFVEQTKLINLLDHKEELVVLIAASSTLGEVIVTGCERPFTGRVGGIGVRTRVIKETKLWKRLSEGKSILKLFPNPVAVNSEVKLQFTKAGNYNLRLIDASGKLIMAQGNLQLSDKIYHLKLPNEAIVGHYFVQILDEKGKHITTEKLLVLP